MALWLCILIGIVIGFVVVSIMKSQLKSVYRQAGASGYMTENSLSLTIRSDRFLYQNTTRTPRPKTDKK